MASPRIVLLCLLVIATTSYVYGACSNKGVLSGANCLCESTYLPGSGVCTAGDAGTCNIPTPEDMKTPDPATLGAGIAPEHFLLYISVPFETTRTVTSIKFSPSATSDWDYPTNFVDWTKSVNKNTCKDVYSFSIETSSVTSLPGFSRTETPNSVSYVGVVYVTTTELLPSSNTREVVNKLAFDFTFPIATVSLNSVDIISPLGSVVTSTLLQRTGADNRVTIQVAVQSHYPYRLNWVNLAANNAWSTDLPVILPNPNNIAIDPVVAIADCTNTADNAPCVQYINFVVRPASATVCSINGEYTLNLAVDGCTGDAPGESCLVKADGSKSKIAVTVDIDLSFEDFCGVTKVYTASASALTAYANAGRTVTKSRYIFGQDTNIYFSSTITPSDVTAYTGLEVVDLLRSCPAGTSTCIGTNVALAFEDEAEEPSATETTAKFSVAISDLTEAADPDAANVVPFTITATMLVYFNGNAKRTITREFEVSRALSTADTKAVGSFIIAPKSSSNDNKVDDTTNTPAATGNETVIGIVGLVVGIVGFVGIISFIIIFVVYRRRNKKKKEEEEAAGVKSESDSDADAEGEAKNVV